MITNLSKWLSSLLFRTGGSPIFIGFSFAFLFAPLRVIFPHDFFSPDDLTQIQSFIEWFGIPYGLLIALVLVNVWTQYAVVEKEFDRESDAVELLFETLSLIDKTRFRTHTNKIHASLHEYVNHIIGNYSQEKIKDIKKMGDAHLKEVRGIIYKIIHGKEESSVSAELLRLINETIDVRGDRISHSTIRMPMSVWYLSLIASTIWVLPFLGLKFDNRDLGFVITFGVVWVVVALLAVIKDLDDPFDGDWKIDAESWADLKKKIQPSK